MLATRLPANTLQGMMDLCCQMLLDDGNTFYSQRVFNLHPQMATAQSGGWTWNGDGSGVFGGYTMDSSASDGDYIEWTEYLPAGSYVLKFLCVTTTASGIADIKIDGVSTGTIDTYSGVATYNVIKTSASFTVTEGSHTVRIQANGKHASSASYRIYLQHVQLIKQDAGSALNNVANVPHIINVPIVFADSHTNWNTLSMNTAVPFGTSLLSSGAQNATVTFSFWAPKGNATLALPHRTGTSLGIYSVSVDGNAWGTIDGYFASGTNLLDTTLSGTLATTGMHTLTLTMATKNASSSNYTGQIQNPQIRMTSITEPIAADLAPEVALLWPVFNEDTGQFTLTVNSGTAYYFYYGNASTQNDEITMSSNTVLRPGTYRLDVIGTRAANAGQLCLLDGGSNVGNADFYGASLGNHIASSAGFALAGFAPHTFKLKSATKNASSSGYFNRFTLARLIRTGS